MIRSLMRANERGISRLMLGEGIVFSRNVSCLELNCSTFSEKFSSIGTQLENMYLKKPSRWILQEKLEKALKDHQVDEALEIYKDFKRLHGFPDKIHMSNLISELSYNSDLKCLRKVSDLVISISKEKPVLLTPDLMTKLSLSLARAQIPVPASNILRLMLEKKNLQSFDVLRMIFLHLVKTEIGTYLASNVLDEILFQKSDLKKSGQTEMTPIFNLVLDACVRFKAPLKGYLIMELMAHNGVKGDAHTAVIIAHLHEINGMRDELKKFKDCVDMVPNPLIHHYRQFYDCLLTLHFKFNDIDSASGLIHELCKYGELDYSSKGQGEQEKSYSVPIGSGNIKMGLRLHFLPQQLDEFFYSVNRKQELVLYKNGKFILSNKGLAKVIIGCKRSGKISVLSKILISLDNHSHSNKNSNNSGCSFCSDVIEACVYMEWLETAHDILEDLESEKYRVRESSYISLLSAYQDKNMQREAEGLERQMRRVGLVTNFSKSKYEKNDLALANSIVHNMRKDGQEVSVLVHQYNSSIYFFTKARMIEDAIETYRKMCKTKIEPNALTFFHLICGCCSIEMYREITHLWGDIKRSNKVCTRDLYELLVLSFIKGGYFERVMEVIGNMMENGMFLDKGSYKNEFLKFHRDLYRSLSAGDAKDEVQRKRIEHVRAFRKLIGIV